MSYRNGSSSEPLTSSGMWSLIAISIFACCVAVVSSKWYREKREKRELAFGGEYGRPQQKSWRATATSSGWRTTSRSGFGSASRIGSPGMRASWNPRREFIPSRPGMKCAPAHTMAAASSLPTALFSSRSLTPAAIIPTIWATLFPPTSR